jgi:hypothetical protein
VFLVVALYTSGTDMAANDCRFSGVLRTPCSLSEPKFGGRNGSDFRLPRIIIDFPHGKRGAIPNI